MQIQSQQQIEILKTHLNTRKLIARGEGKLTCDNANITVSILESSNPLVLMSCNIEGNFITYAGQTELLSSNIIAKENLVQTAEAESIIGNSNIKTPSAKFDGCCVVKDKSVMVVDQANIHGKFTIVDSSIKAAKLITVAENSKFDVKQSAELFAAALYCYGKMFVVEGSINVNSFVNKGDCKIEKTKILARDELSSYNKLLINNKSEVRTKSLNLKGEHRVLDDSEISAILMVVDGDSCFANSKVKIEFLDVEERANFYLVHSDLNSRQTSIFGNAIIRDSVLSVDVIYQTKGIIELKEDATLQGNDFRDSCFGQQNTFPSLGYFAGEVKSSQSKVSLSKVFLNGKSDFDTSPLHATSYLALNSNHHDFSNCQIESKQVVVKNQANLTNSTLLKSAKLQILPQASLVVQEQAKLELNENEIFGQEILRGGKLLSQKVAVLGELQLHDDAVVKATQQLLVETGAKLESSESKVLASALLVKGTMLVDGGLVKAINNIHCMYGGEIIANETKLCTGDEVYISTISKMTGKHIIVRAKTFTNNNIIDVNHLNIGVNFFDNNFGYLDGKDDLSITAEHMLYNICGQVKAKNILINSGMTCNLLGDIVGDNSLMSNSFINLNLFGTLRSYNLNINSLIDFNCGLYLPTLPASLSTVFSLPNLFSFSRMVLTNIFPKSSSAINLSFQAASTAWGIGTGIYDWVCGPQVQEEADSEFGLVKDLLPKLLKLKSLYSTTMGLFGGVSALQLNRPALSLEAGFDAKSMFEDIGTLIGGATTCDSLVAFNGGINASQNVIKNDLYAVNSGIEFGAQSLSHNTRLMFNSGCMGGMQTNLSGHYLGNKGYIVGNCLHIDSTTADLSGNISANRALVKVKELEDAEDLVTKRNRYKDFFCSQNLSVETDSKIHVSGAIDRDCGLELTGSGVRFTSAYNTRGDLRFHSTVDDIYITGNVNANNVSAKSAANTFTTSVICAKDEALFDSVGTHYNLGGNIAGNVVAVNAAEIQNITRGSQLFMQMDPALKNIAGSGGVILGRETYLTARTGSIENHGGALVGTQYLEAKAKGDIRNICNERVCYGKYDTYREYDPAVISGGVGLGDNHVGLYLQCAGKLVNDASSIQSQGDNIICAEGGVDTTARSNTYLAYKKVKKGVFSKRVEKRTETIVQKANIVSSSGRNIIITEAGKVYSVGTNFIAKNGTDVYSEYDSELYDLRTTNEQWRTKKNLFSKSRKHEKHERCEPTIFADNGDTCIYSAKGDVFGSNVVMIGDGRTRISAGKRIILRNNKLKHSISIKSQGFTLSSPLFAIGNHFKNFEFQKLADLDPAYSKIGKIWCTKSLLGIAKNTGKSGVEIYKTYKNISQAVATRNIVAALSQRYGLGDGFGFNPKFTLGYGVSSTKINYETMGPGMIERRSLILEAKDSVTLEGLPVTVHKNMAVRTKDFYLNGQKLESNVKSKEFGVSVGITAARTVVDTAVHFAETKSSNKHYQNQLVQVGGNLHLEVDNLHLEASNIRTVTLTGNVNHMSIIDRQDTSSSREIKVDMSDSGRLVINKQQTVKKAVTEHTGIHVVQGINHDATHKFTVNHAKFIGGQITTEGENRFHANTVERHELHDCKHTQDFTIPCNLNLLRTGLANAFNTNKVDLNNNVALPSATVVQHISLNAQAGSVPVESANTSDENNDMPDLVEQVSDHYGSRITDTVQTVLDVSRSITSVGSTVANHYFKVAGVPIAGRYFKGASKVVNFAANYHQQEAEGNPDAIECAATETAVEAVLDCVIPKYVSLPLRIAKWSRDVMAEAIRDPQIMEISEDSSEIRWDCYGAANSLAKINDARDWVSQKSQELLLSNSRMLWQVAKTSFFNRKTSIEEVRNDELGATISNKNNQQ